MSGLTFEALTGVLNLDASGWDRGFSRAGDGLAKFSAETASEFVRLSKVSGRSIDEMLASAQALASVLDTDVASAAVLMADSLNDPVAGLETLKKAGLEFTESQREQITTLAEAGRMHESQAVLLDGLREKYANATLAAAEFNATNAKATVGGDVPQQSKGGLFGAVPGAANLVKGAAVVAIGKEAIDEFVEAQTAAVRLEAVLKATGNAAGVTADEIREMAEALQETTIYEADATVGAAALLASMKEIKGDVFRRTLTDAADLAAVMGTDLRSAVETLGRSLANPEQGLQRLARAGIYFTDAQKDAIKAMVEVNDIAGAQGIILDEVETRTKGAAAAIGDTFSGALEKMKNALGDTFENLGEGLASLDEELHILDSIKFAFEMLGAAVSLIGNGIAGLIALVKGDMQKLEIYANKVSATFLEARAKWNDVVGDTKEAAALRERADEYRRLNVVLQANIKAQEQANDAAKKAAAVPPPSSISRPAVVATQASGVNGANGAAAIAAAAGEPANPFAGLRDRSDRAKSDASFNRQFLIGATPEQGKFFVSSLNQEIFKAIGNGGLTFKGVQGDKIAGFDDFLTTYREKLSLVPGFSKGVWDKVEADVRQNLRMAAANQGEMREFYLRAVDDALRAGEKMFDDHKRLLDQAAKVQADAHQAINKGAATGSQAKVRTAPRSTSQGDASAAGPSVQEQTDAYFKAIADGSDRDMAARMQKMQAEARTSMQGMALFATPEQMKGLKQFESAWFTTMNAIRSSTGDVRTANVDELKKIEAAWAYAQEQIRAGSKKTVEQLVADAKKEGEAGKVAAEQRAKGSTQRTAKAGGGGGSLDMSGDLAAMSREYSGMLQGAFAGTNLLGGGAAFADLYNQTKDPIEKLNLEYKDTNAKLSQMLLNHSNGVGGNLGPQIDALRNRLTQIQVEVGKAKAEENRQRSEAEEFAAQRNKERFHRERLAQQEKTSAKADAAGDSVTINFHGVTDHRDQVDKILAELNRRGVDRSGRKSPFKRPG